MVGKLNTCRQEPKPVLGVWRLRGQASSRGHCCSSRLLWMLKMSHIFLRDCVLPFWSAALQWAQVPTLPGGSRRRPPWTSPGRCWGTQVQPAGGQQTWYVMVWYKSPSFSKSMEGKGQRVTWSKSEDIMCNNIYLPKSPKPKHSLFTVINDIEKQQIL